RTPAPRRGPRRPVIGRGQIGEPFNLPRRRPPGRVPPPPGRIPRPGGAARPPGAVPGGSAREGVPARGGPRRAPVRERAGRLPLVRPVRTPPADPGRPAPPGGPGVSAGQPDRTVLRRGAGAAGPSLAGARPTR